MIEVAEAENSRLALPSNFRLLQVIRLRPLLTLTDHLPRQPKPLRQTSVNYQLLRWMVKPLGASAVSSNLPQHIFKLVPRLPAHQYKSRVLSLNIETSMISMWDLSSSFIYKCSTFPGPGSSWYFLNIFWLLALILILLSFLNSYLWISLRESWPSWKQS